METIPSQLELMQEASQQYHGAQFAPYSPNAKLWETGRQPSREVLKVWSLQSPGLFHGIQEVKTIFLIQTLFAFFFFLLNVYVFVCIGF